VHGDMAVERRSIKTGLSSGRLVQILAGLKDGEKVVSRGSLFLDRAAGS
jgi:cobalt-zinc-cadmium efflux system membrane fusion protein